MGTSYPTLHETISAYDLLAGLCYHGAELQFLSSTKFIANRIIISF
jgi:hypothetical protein